MVAGALQPEITRAGLPLVVLTLLSKRPDHGYSLLERLRESGFPRIKGGTLYPMLRRLEERGLVEHRWIHEPSGPGRKEFVVTSVGQAELDEARSEWQRLGQTLEQGRKA